jgi:hypothetical protein
MSMQKSSFQLALVVAIIAAGATLSADRVLLRSGRSLDGVFVGADSKNVRILLADGSLSESPIAEVSRVEFTPRTPPTPPPAPAQAAAPAVPKTAAPAPKPITVPAGTMLNVRLTQAIDVDASKTGATFRSLLDDPVMLQGRVVIPRGAAVTLQAASVQQSGSMKGSDKIALKANSISYGGYTYDIVTAQVESKSAGEGKKTARKIGGGAGLGAIVGGIAGGGTGAAIGAAVGGATGAVVASQGQAHLTIPAETRLQFQLSAAVNVRP